MIQIWATQDEQLARMKWERVKRSLNIPARILKLHFQSFSLRSMNFLSKE